MADRLVTRTVHPARGGADRPSGLHGEADRDAEPRALGLARHRRPVALQRVPQNPAHGWVEDLLAPPLGVLDGHAGLRLVRIEGRAGPDRVELVGDRPRPGELATV